MWFEQEYDNGNMRCRKIVGLATLKHEGNNALELQFGGGGQWYINFEEADKCDNAYKHMRWLLGEHRVIREPEIIEMGGRNE